MGGGKTAISQQTPVTVGLVLLVVGVFGGAIFKAGQVLTELDYLKAAVAEIRTELGEIKRLVRQNDTGSRTDNHDNGFEQHALSTPSHSVGSE